MSKKWELYQAGLKGIAEKYDVTLDEALQTALEETEGTEYEIPTREAYEELTKQN